MKVGDYVRFENGTITKINSFSEKDNPLFNILINAQYYNSSDIKVSSPNIIDLIEVGDYVNGHKVFDDMRADTDDYGNDFIEIGIESDCMLNHYIREEDIKSIVTKEQLESMQYKVGEN